MKAYGEFVCLKVIRTEHKSASGVYITDKPVISYEVVNGPWLNPGDKVILMNNDEYKHPYELNGEECVFVDKGCILGIIE